MGWSVPLLEMMPAGVSMTLLLQIISYVIVAVGAILLYETARHLVKRIVQRRFERNLREFLDSPDLYRQSFKFTNKLVIKHQLLSDHEINEKILEYAEREDLDIEEVRAKVERYVEEIVPSFSLFTYFKIGYPIARTIVHSLYDPVVDQERRRILDRIPPNASPVFVMNHRSNFDFVFLSYILAGKVSISYAVGEWARVWPLEHLFKSFGSYFVRRGYKEDLYHKVLERYVQLIATHGVTQAVFPEGRLSRDGRMLPPKLGLINWLAKLEADRDFKRDLVFIPVGVNYDWVLEDENLIKEAKGIRKDTGFWKKAYVVLIGPFMVSGLLIINGTRFLLRRLKLHGYASLSFAEPLALSDWLKERDIVLGNCTAEQREAYVFEFGGEMIDRIGEAVPATPVTVLSLAILDNPQDEYTFQELCGHALDVRHMLEATGVRVVTSQGFQKFVNALHQDEPRAAGPERSADLDEVDAALVKQEETEALVHYAIKLMLRHKLLRKREHRYRIRSGRDDHLRYYANSLAHRTGKSFPIGDPEIQGPDPIAHPEEQSAKAPSS